MKAPKPAKLAASGKPIAPPQPAVVIKTRLPRNYTWAPTGGKPGYVIR